MSRFSKTLQYHCLHTISTHIKPSPQNVTPTNDLQIRLPPNIPMCTKTLILDFLANRGTLSDDEMEILLSNSNDSRMPWVTTNSFIEGIRDNRQGAGGDWPQL
eukprot:m.62103 g.62103  ORF g.62103 m.62103 type:complete len:103 (-) comp23084_c0_seq1:550-858(-)